MQDALAKAIEALPEAGHLQNPESWLFRIAHNTALDACAAASARPRDRPDAEIALIEDPAADAAARVEASRQLCRSLALPPAQRAGVVLMDVLGYSLAETADILGVSIATVKAALHRGRTRLQAAQASAPRPRPL